MPTPQNSLSHADSTQITLYDYWSLTDYLNNWVTIEKQQNNKFSYQFFANKLGLKSKSSIANILAGRRKFTIDSLVALASALRLTPKETEYLEALILYETVDDVSQKQYYRDQLLNLKPAEPAYNIERAYTQFLEKWYISHIRELITLIDFSEDYTELGLLLNPPISAKEAKYAIGVLEDLSLIEKQTKNNKTTYIQTNAAITTPAHLPKSIAIQNHQKETIELGARAITKIKKHERNINNATLSLCDEGVEEMNKLILGFQQQMVKIALKSENKANQVYQTNIQFFPTSIKTNSK